MLNYQSHRRTLTSADVVPEDSTFSLPETAVFTQAFKRPKMVHVVRICDPIADRDVTVIRLTSGQPFIFDLSTMSLLFLSCYSSCVAECKIVASAFRHIALVTLRCE